MNDVLHAIQLAFADRPRPAHFTRFSHCCECAEHDETLRAHDPESIGLEQLSPAWDPITFATLEGYLYYLPGLARLALGTGEDYYLDQFLSNLTPERLVAFRFAQRRAVLDLLRHILESMGAEIVEGDRALLERRIFELDALECMACIPPLARRLFYAVKHSLDDPYVTRAEPPRPKPELGHYADVTFALLAEVRERYRIDRYAPTVRDYHIELTDLRDPSARFRATRQEMSVEDAGRWRSLGGYLYLDGHPLSGTPLDAETP